MQETKGISGNNASLDLLKAVAAVLIVGSHQLPIFPWNVINLYYGHWFFRFCVPLFFLSSGFYFSGMERSRQVSYIKRIGRLYGLSMLLYLPLILKTAAGMEKAQRKTWFIRCFVFGYFHLWYLCALFFALLILYLLQSGRKKEGGSSWMEPGLLVILGAAGVIFGNYYHFFANPSVRRLGDILKDYGGSRNALLFALPVILLGKYLAKHRGWMRMPVKLCLAGLAVSSAFSLAEAVFLTHKLGDKLAADITIFNIWPAVFLFILSFKVNTPLPAGVTRQVRKVVDVLYIIHPWIIYYFARYQWPGTFNFCITLTVSLAVSLGYVILFSCLHKKKQI